MKEMMDTESFINHNTKEKCDTTTKRLFWLWKLFKKKKFPIHPSRGQIKMVGGNSRWR